MATIVGTVLGSSVFNGSNGKHFTLKLSYELVQDKINNKSTITYRLYVVTTKYGSGYGSRVPGYINGVDVGGVTSLSGNTTTLVGTKVEKDIIHNPDGTKSVSYSASMGGIWTGLGYASISGTLTLPRIPRQANIKKANDFNDEGNPYLEFENPGNLTLKISLRIYKATTDNYYEIEYTGTKTSPINWSLTDAQRTTMRNYCNDGVKGKVVYVIKTYSDSSMSTQIGSVSEYTANWNIVNANPTVTLTSEEINAKVKAVVGSNKIALNYLSQIKATATVSLKKSATLKVIDVNGLTNSSSPFTPTINVAQSSGGNSFVVKAKATDSRGNVSSEVLDTYTLVDYRPVSINSRNFARENATSSTIKLNADITYWNSKLNNVDNSLTISYSADGSTFTTIPSSAYTINNTTHKVSISNYTLPTTLDYQKQGIFYLKVVDKYTEDNENEIVTVGIPTMEKGKRVVQVNGALHTANSEGDVQTTIINGDIHNNGMFRNEGNATIVGTTNLKGIATLEKRAVLQQGYRVANLMGTQGTTGYILACRLTILGTYQNQAITMRVLQRSREGSLTIRFASTNSTDPALSKFHKTGDINANIVKKSAGVWDLYIQKSEGYDQIDIVELSRGNYTAISVEWINTNASSLPSGFVEATPEDVYSTYEREIGTWYDGRKIYRKVLNLTLTGQNTRYAHGISNFGNIIKAYGRISRPGTALQNLIPGTYTNWESWIYDFNGTDFTLRFSNNQWNNGISDCQVVLEYVKTS